MKSVGLGRNKTWGRRAWVSLGSLALVGGALVLWQWQLPARLEQAGRRGQIQDCLRLGRQLVALPLVEREPPAMLLQCRRQRAAELWRQDLWQEALTLQAALIEARSSDATADRERLQQWRESLRERALAQFRGGDLNGALRRLQALELTATAPDSGLSRELRSLWTRNRLLQERAERLSAEGRWWEALDSLNRIDHPWWRRRSLALRSRVQAALSRLRGAERLHDSHGALPDSVPPERLDALVRRRIEQGMAEWPAFVTSCRELGGRVVEAGPDSACQR